MRPPWFTAGLALGFAVLPAVGASAHGLSPAISGFYAGGLMVLVTPDDVLQWIALCTFAAMHEPNRAGWTAEALVAGLVGGFALGSLGLVGSFPRWVSGAELLVIGALLSAGTHVPFIVLTGFAATIGLLRGAHDGLDAVGRPDKLALAAGIGIIAYLVMVIGISVLVWLLPHITSIRTVAIRAFGSWVVAIALMLGAFGLVGH